MEKKELNKANIIALIEDNKWRNELTMGMAKTKKAAEYWRGRIEGCETLIHHINVIWPD